MERSENNQYYNLQGLTKYEVREMLGSEFNFFPARSWSYALKIRWWESAHHLVLIFEQEVIKDIYISISYLGFYTRKQKTNGMIRKSILEYGANKKI
ncbi:hypothetical protein [Chryseobacterium sp. HR92]|uniref:hypothetical protein n=1 Tax=Chryseobacterium sp. HR92 TaxID=3094839 RepID=UPI00388D8007|nr:hypothetical protein SFA27_13535 [Chryseobacterium sp. HR92]